MKRARLGLRHLEDGMVVGADRAWAYFSVPLRHDELLSHEERATRLRGTTMALGALAGSECHLLVVPTSHDADAWGGALADATPKATPGFAPYVATQVDHLERQVFSSPEVFLGVALGQERKGRHSTARRTVPEPRLIAWRDKVDALGRLLYGGPLRAEKVPGQRLAGLVRRAFWPGLPTPEPGPGPWSGSSPALLGAGVIENHRHHLVISQGPGEAYLAALCLARFPESLPFPGGEWIEELDRLGFPVQASVRFRVVPAREAAVHARRQLAHTTDQARHIAGTSADIPLALADAREQARQLEYALSRTHTPLAYAWSRLAVWGRDRAELEQRVAATVDAYRDLGIEVARPSGAQLSLFFEAIPGEGLRLGAYEQRHALHTLAGSMFCATTVLGDGVGPYIGTSTGLARRPVCFDPGRAARVNRPTGISVTGEPGAGKTTAAGLLAYQMALRGASCLVLDPKNEISRLTTLPGLRAARVVELSGAPDGILDPFALAATSGEGALLAVDMLSLLLPALAGGEESSLVIAAGRESLTPTPSLSGVVARLGDDDNPVSSRLGETLASYARYPLARLLFGGGGERSALAGEGLTVIQIAGLRLPDPAASRGEATVAERVGLAVMFGLTAVSANLASARRDQPKVVVIDEAWSLSRTRPGAALIERLARAGRSSNAVLVLVSQNAADLLGEQVTNCLGIKLAFRSRAPQEVDAVLRLLGLDPTPAHRELVASLRNGECIFSDLDGRSGTVGIDLVTAELAAALDTTPGIEKESPR